ncbi:MAG: metal-dependent protein hydrolase [Candidatus Taylorbacteria bacterium]|nr:metal-dependent protein hydrolase [Candidatus Taylorbacteria bacterium]
MAQKTLVTHNGTFHADDVFAVAAFLIANNTDNDWQVVRSRDEEVINKADAAIDVGGIYDIATLRFDHHQVGGAGIRANGVPYASFGLVWNIFGDMITMDKWIKEDIENKLVLSIDANDNGIKLSKNNIDDVYAYEISTLIADFNITWKEESDSTDNGDKLRYENFMYLVGIATKLIQRLITRARDKYAAKEFVIDAYNKATDKRVVILDGYYPWQDILLNMPEPLFVIFPNGENWSLKTVSKEKGSFESRKQLPENWAGLRDEELAKVTGVPDAYFCHNARFMANARSKEGVLALAKLALE